MKGKKILRKSEDIVTRVIDDETILLPIYKNSNEINCIYTLNKAASRVWQMVDGKKTLKEIKSEVLGQFDTTAQEAEQKIDELFKDLREIKALA